MLNVTALDALHALPITCRCSASDLCLGQIIAQLRQRLIEHQPRPLIVWKRALLDLGASTSSLLATHLEVGPAFFCMHTFTEHLYYRVQRCTGQEDTNVSFFPVSCREIYAVGQSRGQRDPKRFGRHPVGAPSGGMLLPAPGQYRRHPQHRPCPRISACKRCLCMLLSSSQTRSTPSHS